MSLSFYHQFKVVLKESSMFKTQTLPLMFALGVVSTTLFADVTIQFENSAKNQPSSLYVKEGKVLIESKGGNGNALYDSKKSSFSVLQHSQKSYIRMSEEKMEQQMGMMENMRRQMMARMQSMPPAQREMIEQRMEKMGLPSMQAMNDRPAEAKTSIKKLGKWQTINGFKCEMIEVYRGDKRISEACIADAKGLKISQADFDTLMSLFDFSQKMAKKAGKAGAIMNDPLAASGGIPVQSKNLLEESVQTIGSVSTQTLENSKFQIPSDYSEMKMPGME